MPSFEILLAFFITTAMFSYLPGPAMIYVSAQTIARGQWAGFMAALGVHLGGYAHVLLAAFGLAALLTAVPALYMVVKIAGAAYLVYLGVMMIVRREKKVHDSEAPQTKSAKRAFFESISVEVLNPKTALFFVSFLPQFVSIDASLPIWAQMVILGTIVNVMFSSADLVCVLFAGWVLKRLTGPSARSAWLQRIGGTFLIGLGAKLALERS
ncbi:threonine/homoserine/homoserine lactone efflux protein [Maritalea mobilis]|uniref:Threonine/homoserine/homoserine lactone efflux protein n=1 Tax=Maritalea mobilis TaxID=483324 RepID=A0A4R6VTC3_9HYPH|nr:LysE family translocator [Maritalea mobilis]TDQ67342.1 threonine/homoserine/homoserine lactone efflux protein [Maritalea mobilis]